MFWFALLTLRPVSAVAGLFFLCDRVKAFAPARGPGRSVELVSNLLAQIQLIERRLVSRSRGALEVIKQPAAAGETATCTSALPVSFSCRRRAVMGSDVAMVF
jgi:hypothetical protein